MAVLNQIRVNRDLDCIQNLQHFFYSILIPHFCRNARYFEALFFGVLFIARHFRSRTTILSGSLSFVFLEMCRSDSILKKLVFSSFRLFFSSSKMLLNFLWQSSIILTKSSLFKRIRDDSIWDIFQVVKAQVQLSTTEKTADVSLRLTYLFSLRRSAGLTSGASFDEGYIGINIFQFFFLSGFCFTNIYESQDCKGNGREFH